MTGEAYISIFETTPARPVGPVAGVVMVTCTQGILASGLWGYWWLFAVLAVLVVLSSTLKPKKASSWKPSPEGTLDPVEARDTWTLTFEPEAAGRLDYEPGQVSFLDLREMRERGSFSSERFTISSSPAKSESMTITALDWGDYTRTVVDSRDGSEAPMIGIRKHRLKMLLQVPRKFLFISTEIGVETVMDILRHLRDSRDSRPVMFVYGSCSEIEPGLRQELEALPGNVRIVHVLYENEQSWLGPTNYITSDILKEHAADFLEDSHAFLCGQDPVMPLVGEELLSIGIDGRRIHFESRAG